MTIEVTFGFTRFICYKCAPDADLEHKARLQALDDIKKGSTRNGHRRGCARNAERDIRKILEGFGMEKIAFACGA